MEICRYCKQEGADTKTYSYWNHLPDWCHAACKKSGEAEEAFDCQSEDADCNDCGFFKRGKLADKVESIILTTDGRKEKVTHQPEFFYGTCLKFNTPTIGQPNKWSGKSCFVHRKLCPKNNS